MGHESLNKEQISGRRRVRGRQVVLNDRTRLSWSAGPCTVLQRLLLGSGCTVRLQWVDAMPVTSEQARDQPSPTLKKGAGASVVSYGHIGIKCLLYTSALFVSPSSQDTSLNN